MRTSESVGRSGPLFLRFPSRGSLPMRSQGPWCFSHPTTAATSRERNYSWMAAWRKCRPLIADGSQRRRDWTVCSAGRISARLSCDLHKIIAIDIVREPEFGTVCFSVCERLASGPITHDQSGKNVFSSAFVSAGRCSIRQWPVPGKMIKVPLLATIFV